MKSLLVGATLIISATSFANSIEDAFSVSGRTISCSLDCSSAEQRAIQSAEKRAAAVCSAEGKQLQVLQSRIKDTTVNTRTESLMVTAETTARCQ